jgi:hypothetical protein
MIIQIVRAKNELFLLKEMLPLWTKYADGFIFFDDFSIDGSYEYLIENKDKYNILDILRPDSEDDYINKLKIETDSRQALFDAAFKHSNKILCCDADEYFDGSLTKQELESLLDMYTDSTFALRWVQYTGKSQIRVDGPWRNNFKVRIGNYAKRESLGHVQMHSLHLPSATNNVMMPSDKLFISHLQWLDKRWVGVKQYFWKINDYVNSTIHGAQVIGLGAYDVSVNNFIWEYDNFAYPLKVNEKIYSLQDIKNNYKLQFIKYYTNKLNIPNLGDWGMGIYEYCKKVD